MQLFFEDNDVTDTARQATKIKIALGDEDIRRLLASHLTDEQRIALKKAVFALGFKKPSVVILSEL